MDFVVIGLGLSALALLTGLSLLCVVAPRWLRKTRQAAQPAESPYAQAMAGERAALGQAFLCVGAVLLLATLGGISAGLADKAGAYLIAAVTTVAALCLWGWDLLYRHQHPIPVRRREPRPQAKPAILEPGEVGLAADLGTLAATTMARRRVLPARQRVSPAARPTSGAAATPDVTNEVQDAAGDDRFHPDGRDLTPDVEDAELSANSGSTTATTEEGSPPTADASETMSAEPVAEMDSSETHEDAPTVPGPTLPEPVPIDAARTRDDPSGSPSIGAKAEPDVVPNGDDRVIALFPTAAARRGRTIAAPTDPDGQD